MNEHKPPPDVVYPDAPRSHDVANSGDLQSHETRTLVHSDTSQTQHRVRIYFRKGQAIKYISHLDLLRAWERAIRRSGLPLAYSQGFSPHPRITIAIPLAVGCTGQNEILDIILEEPVPEHKVIQALAPVMPEGLSAISAEEVALGNPALATLLSHAVYEVLLIDIEEDEVRCRIAEMLRQETIPVEFRRKRFDLRPLIGSLTLGEVDSANSLHGGRAESACYRNGGCRLVKLCAVLLRDERGRIGRPDVLLQALGLSEHARRIHRVQLVFHQT